MTIPSHPITLDELERHETVDLLKRCPAHRRLLAKLRDERAFDAELVRERAILDAAIAEHQRRASVVRHVLPQEGGPDDLLIVSLRGSELAREQRDGVEHSYVLEGAIGFIEPNLRERIAPQVPEALRIAHPQRHGQPWSYVIAEPGARRDDLCELIGQQHPIAQAREVLLQNLAQALPVCETAARWFRSASESRDAAASAVASAIHRTFARAGRVDELAASAAAE